MNEEQNVGADMAQKTFEFRTPIFGFPDATRYAITEIPGGGEVFKQMVALDQPDLAFTLVLPQAFFPDYAPDIPEAELQEIGVTEPEQAIVMAILTAPKAMKDATANLRAPLVFNPFTKQARQVVLSDDRYPIRARLLKA